MDPGIPEAGIDTVFEQRFYGVKHQGLAETAGPGDESPLGVQKSENLLGLVDIDRA